MTPNESQMLDAFLVQLRQAEGIPQDPQAAALIAQAVTRQSDAAYLLVQRALMQDQALAVAQQRIASLEAQLRAAPVAPAPASSFLDSGSNAWGRSAAPASATPPAFAPAAAPSAVPAGPAQPVAEAAPARPGFLGGGGGSFLGTMAATAAGVAGGAFLFQGIGNLMGHHGGGEAAHAAGQTNAFSSMADSVDKTPAAAPLAAPEVADTTLADNDTDSSADDIGFDSDDSII